MPESEGEDRTLEASAHKLRQAREQGQVAISREGSAVGVMIAGLIGVLLMAGGIARKIAGIMVPLLDQPDQYLSLTPQGVRNLMESVAEALGLAILPFFGLLAAGAFLPYLLQGSITVTGQRLVPKLSHISPGSGVKRLFSLKGLFEFVKSLFKLVVIAAVCFILARPIYAKSLGLVSTDLVVLPQLLQNVIVELLTAGTLISAIVAAIDIPYQHFSFRRSMRMSLQEMRDELRSTEGDPHIKGKVRRLARQRAQRRMMHDVPKATVVITNPTHFAVALRYRRGEDPAPVVVAKGIDLIAQRIRQTAAEHGVAVMENPPLARALHAAVEIGEVIPHEHFEAVAKIIGLVWARRVSPASQLAGRN